VLIHAAAGGVGHAAISVCQHVGATIFATASVEKRAAVRAMGVEHVYDSRSTSWFQDLMRDTDSRGVDVVLNSLAGKHQRLGVEALAPGGRFLEIGKLDIYDNRKIGLMALRKNASFTAIDMDRLAVDDPDLTIRTTVEVFDLLAQGYYHPIPASVFPMDRIAEAIDTIKAGKHVGKVVLSNYTETDHAPVPVRVQSKSRIFRPDATYLITGGAGGFGSKIVRHAFDQGARHFVITVTRDPKRVEALFKDIMDVPGCTMDVIVADTAREEDMAELVRFASSRQFPLKGVFHVAGISIDTVLSDLVPEDLMKVAGCKAMGTWYLHEHTKHLEIDTFVAISSIASLVGGRGRAAYASSNAFIDAVIRMRHRLGLPGTAFNMTGLSDVGILATEIKVRQLQLRSNVEFVQSSRALRDLEDAVALGLPLGCQLFFREKTVGVYPNRASFLHGGLNHFTLGADSNRGSDRVLSVREVQTMLTDVVKAIGGHENVAGSSALFSVGMDSFSTVELLSKVKELFGVEVPPSKLGPSTTVADLTKLVHTAQAGQRVEADDISGGPEEPAAAGADAGLADSSVAAIKSALVPRSRTMSVSRQASRATSAPSFSREKLSMSRRSTHLDGTRQPGPEDAPEDADDSEMVVLAPIGCFGEGLARDTTQHE
jgi:phthiocerol/phenolphthiocerol synthesis type-I polyketide synthase C